MSWQGKLDPKYIAFLENSIRGIFGSLSVEKSLQPWLEHCCFCQITWLTPQPAVAAASPVCLLVLKQNGRQGGWGGLGGGKLFPCKERQRGLAVDRSQDKQDGRVASVSVMLLGSPTSCLGLHALTSSRHICFYCPCHVREYQHKPTRGLLCFLTIWKKVDY